MSREDFFNDTTVETIVQRNIERVSSLEEVQQRKLLRVFRRVRQDLNDRLLTIPEGTFTEQQLNVTLVQVQAAIQAIKSDLKNGMVESSEILASRGVRDLIVEITKFSKKFEGSVQPLNIDAVLAATNAQNFLLNKHQASIDAYGEALRSQITSNLAQSMALRDTTGRTVSRLVRDVGKFFQGEEFKLNRIVRTELHNIYNFSKLSGMQDTKETDIPDLKKSLMHPMDARTGEDSKQLADKNPIVDIDEPFIFIFRRRLKDGTIKEDRREFMFPPDRPNDRAILVPFREEWGKQASKFSPGGKQAG